MTENHHHQDISMFAHNHSVMFICQKQHCWLSKSSQKCLYLITLLPTIQLLSAMVLITSQIMVQSGQSLVFKKKKCFIYYLKNFNLITLMFWFKKKKKTCFTFEIFFPPFGDFVNVGRGHWGRKIHRDVEHHLGTFNPNKSLRCTDRLGNKRGHTVTL